MTFFCFKTVLGLPEWLFPIIWESAMPTIKLTEKAIARLPAPDPSSGQMLHWDSELKGFGVLCSGTTGAKSYVVQHALKDGRRRRDAPGRGGGRGEGDAKDLLRR